MSVFVKGVCFKNRRKRDRDDRYSSRTTPQIPNGRCHYRNKRVRAKRAIPAEGIEPMRRLTATPGGRLGRFDYIEARPPVPAWA